MEHLIKINRNIMVLSSYVFKWKRLHVNHFVVNELSRGLGVGTMLMKEVEQYAKDNEIKSIDLMVTSSSHSVKFYERKWVLCWKISNV